MTAIRQPGPLNDNTSLIDTGLMGAAGISGVYLIKAGKTCLIDAGPKDIGNLMKGLAAENVTVPDIVVLTHAHWDHCQGLRKLREQAKGLSKNIEVFASEKAIPLLEDQSYNKVFNKDEEFPAIHGVKPIRNDDTIDLDGVTLRILDTPGHSHDGISVFDETNKTLFVGDALGMHIADGAVLPAFMPPHWDEAAFHRTVNTIRSIDYESICPAHFGCFIGDGAKGILDEAVAAVEQWWSIFESVYEAAKLDDLDYLIKTILENSDIQLPEIELLSAKLSIGLKLLNIGRRVRGKDSIMVAEILLHDTVMPWLVKSFLLSKGIQ